MNIIKSSRNFDWIISPYRETIVGRGFKAQITKKAKFFECEYICITDQKHISFSNVKGQDFAVTLRDNCGADSFIYIEWANDVCIFVHVRNGQIIEDRVIYKMDALLQSLNVVANARIKRPNYVVETFALPANEKVDEILDQLTGKSGKVTSAKSSRLETLEFSPKYSFEIRREAERHLADKNKQSYTVIFAIATLLTYGLFSYFNDEELAEKIVLKDDYKEYTNIVMSSQLASVVLAQDFNIHRLFKRELNGWKIIKVTYSTDSIVYTVVLDYGSPSTLLELNNFVDRNNLKLIFDEEGTHVISPFVKATPYKNTHDVRRYDLDLLVSNVVDNSNKISPYIGFKIEQQQSQNEFWGERNIVVRFNGAVDHDLLRLAAVIDGYPERYPILIKEKSSYQVDPSGVFSEGVKFGVVGDLK